MDGKTLLMRDIEVHHFDITICHEHHAETILQFDLQMYDTRREQGQ